MAVVLRIPAHLRVSADGLDRIELQGGTLGEVLGHLGDRHSDLRAQLVDDVGRPRRCLRLYVNDDDAATGHGLDTPVRDGDEITVLLALAGG
ncbi:MoaD/ThiS family protein [Fodinibacter luteus]|uniref:MoaD/ThiS family protein n=1 Tax=Fodinibacter luteus TaxID=552064 RepID=A0ABP8K9N7_9MICO